MQNGIKKNKKKRSFGSAKGEFKLKESFNAPVGACNFYDNIMTKLKHVKPGKKFTRNEMNDRK